MAKKQHARALTLLVLALAVVLTAAAPTAAEDLGALAQQYQEVSPSVWQRVSSSGMSVSLSCSQPGPGEGYPQVDCTGSASGGSPPYHAYWTDASGSEYEAYGSPDSGPWVKTTICKYGSPYFEPYTLRLRVVDSDGSQSTRSWFCGLAL